MTLAEIDTRGDMETEVGTSYSQIGLPMEGGRGRSIHQHNLQPKLCPAYKIHNDKDGVETEGTAI